MSATAAPLSIVVLGLSLSSSWGNGHATTWRALLRAFAARGHKVLFLERDVPWYAAHRDLLEPPFCELALYGSVEELGRRWGPVVAQADAVIVGSFVPDGVAVGQLVQRIARGIRAFYDIDTPVTLAKLARGDNQYLSPELISGFDLYLSFTGGPTLAHIMRRYGASAARQLYCSVDEAIYRPRPEIRHRWDLSYLGTYSPDRQPALERLLLEPARRAPQLRFAVAGAQYPDFLEWPGNVERLQHVPPQEHPAFYAASRYTLNITREDMRRAGWSPSVRLFEAGACATPVISDDWPGLDELLTPGAEILIAESGSEVLEILLQMPDAQRLQVGTASRRRVLAGQTSSHRAAELEMHLRDAEALRHRGALGRSPATEAVENQTSIA